MKKKPPHSLAANVFSILRFRSLVFFSSLLKSNEADYKLVKSLWQGVPSFYLGAVVEFVFLTGPNLFWIFIGFHLILLVVWIEMFVLPSF